MPTKTNYSGDLTRRALTGTMHNKNIKCEYRKPKQVWEIKEQAPNYKGMSVDGLKALIPQNWFDDTSDSYWEESLQTFWGKDGQSNAYVKSGLDDEVMEYFDREENHEYIWRVQTDDAHIDFKSGGKVLAMGREWFIMKVIIMANTGTYQNKFYAMNTSNNNPLLKNIGIKLLVLV